MNQKQCEEIHRTSLALLENPGIKIEHSIILDMLMKNGAKPGNAAEVVRLEQNMIEEYLKLCPSEVVFSDRSGSSRMLTSRSEPLFWSTPALRIVEDNQTRPFSMEDMGKFSFLMEHLEHVDGVFGVSMDDVPPGARDFVGLRVMANNTRKHLRVLSCTKTGCEALIEMKKVVSDSPWFSMGFTAHGPLRWTNLALEIFAASAGQGIPVTVNGEPMAGASGPVTLAGSIAVGNAEILAGLVINQILEPERPCVYNLGLAHVMDMKSMIAVTGGPENSLMAQASAAMGRFYNLPSCSWVSTEAMIPDGQAIAEKMFGFHSHIEGGVNLIWGAGQLESEMALSMEQAVIDNELIAYAKRFKRGFEINPETLALNVVREIGIGGEFLGCEHTFRHFRENFEPEILCRQSRELWRNSGAKSLNDKAKEKVANLLKEYPEPVLKPEQIKELLKIEQHYFAKMNLK